MKLTFAIFGALLATTFSPTLPGRAQVMLSGGVTQGQLASVQATASQALTLANTAVQPAALTSAITAATPTPCGVPLPDTLLGSAGTGSTCMPRVDASRPAIVQATTVITAGDGSFTGNWPTPFVSAPTGRIADIETTAGNNAPFKCSFVATTVTATGFTGKCWQIVATTLPTTATALLGLTVSPLQNAAAGLTVRVTGRQ